MFVYNICIFIKRMNVTKILLYFYMIMACIYAEDTAKKTKTKLIPTKTQSYVGRLHPGQDIMQTLT